MNNSELIKNLRNLKMKPDENWKNSNREILYSQISNLSATNIINNVGNAYEGWQKKFLFILQQPALAVAAVCILIIGGSAFSLRAAGSKPGSSLYMARVISEQARLAMTFDDKEKAKLDFKFTSEHVKDIAEVLSDPNLDSEDQKKAVELTQNFKKEITAAKSKLLAIKKVENPEQNVSGQPSDDDAAVFSANLEKEETGLQVSSPEQNNETPVLPQTDIKNATSTETPNNSQTFVGKAAAGIEEAHQFLNEAEQEFDNKNYSATLNKLEQAEAIVNDFDSDGQVKGESEATSTGISK